MHRDAVYAMAHFGVGVGKFELRPKSAVDRPPRVAGIVASERASGRDGCIDALRGSTVEQNGVQAHAAGAGLPKLSFGAAETGQFLPCPASVGRFKYRRILDTGIDGVGIGQRRFEMPHALKFPRTLCAVIMLVRRKRPSGFCRCIVHEHVAFTLRHTIRPHEILRFRAWRVPGLAAIIGPLNDLPKPAARLRGIEAVAVSR
jgi:hypothetical protein